MNLVKNIKLMKKKIPLPNMSMGELVTHLFILKTKNPKIFIVRKILE